MRWVSNARCLLPLLLVDFSFFSLSLHLSSLASNRTWRSTVSQQVGNSRCVSMAQQFISFIYNLDPNNSTREFSNSNLPLEQPSFHSQSSLLSFYSSCHSRSPWMAILWSIYQKLDDVSLWRPINHTRHLSPSSNRPHRFKGFPRRHRTLRSSTSLNLPVQSSPPRSDLHYP